MTLATVARRWAALWLLLLGSVAGNLWWLYQYRRGLPFNIDESGYLQRAVLYGQLLRGHGLSGLTSQWTTPDIVAPILPLTTGIIRSADTIGLWQMLATQQIYFALTILATYLLARQFTTRNWALVPTFVVACSPGILDAGRLYYLAEPAVALFTLLLALQIRAKDFSSLSRSILWGTALGATTLTRTIMVAFIAAPGIAAVLQLIASKPTSRAVRNFAFGVLSAVIVAGSWYAWSWHTVWKYLTGYGYGAAASSYGHSHSITSPSWWIARATDLVNQDLYAPIAIALVLCSAIVLFQAIWKQRFNSTRSRARTLPDFRRRLTGGSATLLISLVGTYLVLSSSQNGGSYFELPLIPPLVVIMLIPLHRIRPVIGLSILACVLCAASLAAMDQYGVLVVPKSAANVDLGEIHLTAFTTKGVNFLGQNLQKANIGGGWRDNCGEATITCFYGRKSAITTSYLKPWLPLSHTISSFLYQYAAHYSRQPVVFFASQGPLLNTNTVSLAAQLDGHTLPIGALLPPDLQQGSSLRQQLESPKYGEPNFVITTRDLGTHHGREAPAALFTEVSNALKGDDFKIVRGFPLPDNMELQIWWKDR